MQRLLITFALAAVAALPATRALAEPRDRTVRVRVSGADLDLQSPEGADAMLGRLRAAAHKACGGRPPIGPLGLSMREAFETCQREAVIRAVADLGSPVVTRRFEPSSSDRQLASR